MLYHRWLLVLLVLPMALAGADAARPPHQLPVGYFVPAKFPLVAIHPRPDSETPPAAYHRVAHPGLRWDCPVRAAFGAYPYHAQLVTGPEGMTIGSWLARKPDGELVEDAAYCTLTWIKPVAGTYPIAVRLTDQDGKSVDLAWTLVVAPGLHYFAAPVAGGKGDGSTWADRAAFTAVYGDTHEAVSPAQGKVLVLSGGSYTLAQPFRLDARWKPNSVVAMPGETPEITATTPEARFAFKSNDGFIAGLHLKNFGPKGCIFTYEAVHRLTVWRNAFTGLIGDPKISDNESAWYCSRLDQGKRRHLLMAENTYVDCVEVAVFDFYTVGPMLSERDVFTTRQKKISEPLWFPKSMCDYDIRRHVFDNPGSEAPGSAVMAGYNAKHEGGTSSGEVRYNFVRSAVGGGLLAQWNQASTAATRDCYDYRNTYIGAAVASRDWLKGNHVLFEADVIQNRDGGINRDSGGFTSQDGECHGMADIVDQEGKLTGTFKERFLGRRGYHIHDGKSK